MFKNTQKGNIYLLLTILVVAFLTAGTVIYLNFPEEQKKISIIFPPHEQYKQREIQLSEVLQSLVSGGTTEMSETQKKELKKALDNLNKTSNKKSQEPVEIPKGILDSLVNPPSM